MSEKEIKRKGVMVIRKIVDDKCCDFFKFIDKDYENNYIYSFIIFKEE